MAGGTLYEQVDQYWERLTTQWERLTTLHRAFILSGLVFLLSCVVTLPGLLSIYFLSILSALAIAKILNESNSFQASDSLLKYVYFIVNFYFQHMSDLQKHWKKKEADQLSDATTEELFERHSQSSLSHNNQQQHVTNSATQHASLPNEELHFRTHIFNDFILSWYTSLSHHQQVPEEFLTHLKYLFQTFTKRSKQMDVHSTVNRILFELRKHVSQFRISSLKLKQLPLNSRSTLAEVYGHYFEIHQATQNQRFMEDYLRQVASLLMWFLLPSDIYRCYAGNLLLQEILTCNVFISLVDLLSDPNTLNDIILLLMIDDEVTMNTEKRRIIHSSEEKHPKKVAEGSDLKVIGKVRSSQDIPPKSKGQSSIDTLPTNGSYKQEGVAFRNDSSDSDDQKVLQTSLVSRPNYLDFNDTKVLKVGSLPSHQGFPSSPTKPTLYRCKSSPVLSQPEQSTIDLTESVPSIPLKKMPSLTSLVSFQSIPPDEEDSELWFLDGEENAQDGFVITKDPGPEDDQLVLYNKHDAGFASDTIKMLHGMVDTALSKLPSMEVNPMEDDDDEGDGVFSNLMENIKNWKTSIEDELEEQFIDHDEPSSNKDPPEDDQSNWGHDFVKEQEKKLPSMLATCHKDITQQKKNVIKHANSVATYLQSNGDSGQKTAVQKRAAYGSRSKTIAVLEDLATEVSNINNERSSIWIQTMLIVDTETMKDQRNITKDYTLYIIKYQALIWKGEEHPKEAETHWLKRRFREFTNLQSRLEENSSLKPLLKGIKDVPRKLQLVKRMNEDVVLHRKHSLERYLQNLCSIPAICSSSEFQEFIALEGDTHIEFVKKAPELVPRIDKFFLRGMSGIMGTLKSKLPSSTALPSNPAVTGVDHEDSRQLDDSLPEMPTSPFAELDTSGPQRSYVFRTRDTSVAKNVDVLLKSFLESRVIDSKTPVDNDQETDENIPLFNMTTTSEPIKAVFQHYSEDDKKELNYAEIPLADEVMCLLCEVLHDYGNWVVKETTQQIVAVAFGKLINKLIEDTVDRLVTEGMCARYLQLIRQELWPNGQLLSNEYSPKTDEKKEQSRRIAFQKVKDFMPGIVTHGIGEEELENCLLFVHASLQDPSLNRHLVFTLIDILMDALLPEIHDLNFRERIIKEAAL